jgi:hypothetical protein
MHARIILIALTLVALTGCAGTARVAGHDHRDRAYDPCDKCGETLFDQVRVSR